MLQLKKYFLQLFQYYHRLDGISSSGRIFRHMLMHWWCNCKVMHYCCSLHDLVLGGQAFDIGRIWCIRMDRNGFVMKSSEQTSINIQLYTSTYWAMFCILMAVLFTFFSNKPIFVCLGSVLIQLWELVNLVRLLAKATRPC